MEYSTNIRPLPNLHEVLKELHEILPTVLTDCDPLSIKSRAVGLDIFRVANQPEGAGLVHLEVAIMTGRTSENRKATSGALVQMLGRHFRDAMESQPLSITVEIREMEKMSYGKYSLTGG
jgi:5-carboxymethyl-2-hydroxymuconate isomerase